MEFLSVSGHDNLVRDTNTNSIINKNKVEYEEYISRREEKRKDSLKIQKLEDDIVNMKNDLDEIKFLLRRLADGS